MLVLAIQLLNNLPLFISKRIPQQLKLLGHQCLLLVVSLSALLDSLLEAIPVLAQLILPRGCPADGLQVLGLNVPYGLLDELNFVVLVGAVDGALGADVLSAPEAVVG